MTDRHAAYIVVMEKDRREDDAASTVEALKHIKGVLDVEPVIAGVETHIAESRVRSEYAIALMDTIRKVLSPSKGDSA